MDARTPLLVTLCLSLCACSDDAEGSRDRVGAGARQEDASSSDAKAVPEPQGVPGAHVWFDASVGVEVSNHWVFTASGNPGSSGSRCYRFERDALNDAQLAALDAITLIPVTSACTADGFDYWVLTVLEADGTSARYADTGCSYLGIEGAKAMLPRDAIDRERFASGGTLCDPSN